MAPIDPRVSPKLLHVPLQPPRTSVPREGLLLALWQQFAEQRPEEWRYIFITNGPVRQRAASVAASFMTFMGCNCGRDFTHAAERLATSGAFTCTEDAYLAAWTAQNKRNQGVNHGLRTIEYMLAREHPIKLLFYEHRVNWKQVPDVSMEDIDIVESMVRWWCSTTARWMRDAVEAQMEAREANERLFRATPASASQAEKGG
ncbi:hypothetical protein LZ683_08555 [Comamonas testosteroni]|uniref:hypothetical protein n=1 Tax=Comamonas testosteroni TaxID=285 RepID=UPI0023AB5412|nr:hypothetical protein [Comamonas testosteroni]WEE79391.1 hypothetical protein LZ683_08555 [Comamonas testosteroni]